jgi:hypothetical protein
MSNNDGRSLNVQMVSTPYYEIPCGILLSLNYNFVTLIRINTFAALDHVFGL